VFAFVNIADWLLITCVKIHLWFFNLLLKGCGIGWQAWSVAMTKLLFPKRREDFQVFRDSFDKDNPIPPYKCPRNASTNSTKTSVTLRAARLATFGMINLSTVPTFILTSESRLYSRIRRYRGMQGMLDSTKVPVPDLAMLRHGIHMSGQDIGEAVVAQDKTFTAIADSGCSITCTNDKADHIPGTRNH
jgi:hypothetical protein